MMRGTMNENASEQWDFLNHRIQIKTSAAGGVITCLHERINVEKKRCLSKVGTDVLAGFLHSDGRVEPSLDLFESLAYTFMSVWSSCQERPGKSGQLRYLICMDFGLTEVSPVQCEKGSASPEIDTTPYCIARLERWSVELANVLRGKDISIVAVIAPGLGLPAWCSI